MSYTSPKYPRIGEPLIKLQRVDSTNNYAMALVESGRASHGMAILAEEQTHGKGQRGKTWVSAADESLTMSIILFPDETLQQIPFRLSALTALACYDLLKYYGVDDLSIKWPNDLYWRDRKAGGILIETRYRAGQSAVAVIGIGMNINRNAQDEVLPIAVSMEEILQQRFSASEIARELCNRLDMHFASVTNDPENNWVQQFNEVLYKRGQTVKLQTRKGILETTIIGINRSGALLTTGGIFYQGDIVWLRE